MVLPNGRRPRMDMLGINPWIADAARASGDQGGEELPADALDGFGRSRRRCSSRTDLRRKQHGASVLLTAADDGRQLVTRGTLDHQDLPYAS